jgi:response regulator RpfG family c-di-GMP phosphodiesterase
MGGDEFCAVLEGTRADALGAEASGFLAEEGEGFSIGASFGAVAVPAETVDPPEALRLADGRMYARKHSGRVSADRQSRDVLLRVLAERNPELSDHLDGVADLAAEVAVRMGLDDASVALVRHAAELHDVGKIAIPDAILSKPGPLDEGEWAFMHRHTLIGERIVLAAPALRGVAGLVRASHERWDGSGYPDGLTGDEIPLGARIVAVCDAFDAMVTDRSYRDAVPEAQALAELCRCAGGQFDPAVVRAFVAVRTAVRERPAVAA